MSAKRLKANTDSNSTRVNEERSHWEVDASGAKPEDIVRIKRAISRGVVSCDEVERVRKKRSME